MAKPIHIGEHYFPTKKAATEEIRNRINKYNFGETLHEEDQLFFSELFKLHSEYAEKMGSGMSHITVERDFKSNRNLYIHRVDGTEIDISWVHCVQPISEKTTILLAYRRAVRETVIAFRNEQLDAGAVCPFLSISLVSKNSHVTYPEMSFNDLVEGFLGSLSLELSNTELTNPVPSDDDQRGILKDKKLESAWQKYHDENAVMRLISKKAHLSRAS